MNAPVENKALLLKLLLTNKKEILSFGVSRIGLFGSFVRNEVKEQSDIDFVVVFKEGEKNYDNYIGLAFF